MGGNLAGSNRLVRLDAVYEKIMRMRNVENDAESVCTLIKMCKNQM